MDRQAGANFVSYCVSIYSKCSCTAIQKFFRELAQGVRSGIKHWPVGSLTRVGGMVALPLAIQLANVELARQRPPFF